MSSYCAICKKVPGRRSCILVCSGDCGEIFHVSCATDKFGYDPADLTDPSFFRCDPCAMHRSKITPRTPDLSPARTTEMTDSSSSVTLQDVFAKLNQSSASTNAMLQSIQGALLTVVNDVSEIRTYISELRTDVSRLSSSHEMMSKRVSELDRKVENTVLDAQAIRSEHSALQNRVDSMASDPSRGPLRPSSAEITLTGIPVGVHDPPQVMVQKVFQALGIPDLVSDILEIRPLTKKNFNPVGEHATTSASPNLTSLSFVVTLKSTNVRDFSIAKKRAKKNLTVREVFSLDSTSSIFVNEMLDSSTYKLLRKAKAKVKSAGFKNAWYRGNRIYLCKSDGQPNITINNEADLDNLC